VLFCDEQGGGGRTKQRAKTHRYWLNLNLSAAHCRGRGSGEGDRCGDADSASARGRTYIRLQRTKQGANEKHPLSSHLFCRARHRSLSRFPWPSQALLSLSPQPPPLPAMSRAQPPFGHLSIHQQNSFLGRRARHILRVQQTALKSYAKCRILA
jgi:hypothetical protein